MYAISHGDDSSDDKTALAGEWVARVLQSRFDRGEEDVGFAGSISIETHSSRRRSVKTASISSKSYNVSSGASSWRRPTKGRGPPEERCKPRIS